jgi:dihydroflavonol-4-reductase
MRVTVIGADGLLGSNLVRELLSRGHEVVASIQPGRTAKTLEGLPLERYEADILDKESVEKVVNRCDAVIHCAANTSVWPLRSALVNRVNLEGTRHVIEAVKKNRIRRLIYVGTANSFGFGTKKNPGVEGNPYKSFGYGIDYMDSKYHAQMLILKEVQENGLPAVIVNPTFMFGPYDSGPSSGAMILAVYKGKVPGFTRGGRNYLCARDAAVAISNALSAGRIGECYILGNENLSYREVFSKIAATIGAKTPTLPIPPFFAKAFGRFGSVSGKLTGKAPSVSYPMACIACDDHYFTAAKAVKELGLPQTPVEVGIRECFEWMKEQGFLK